MYKQKSVPTDRGCNLRGADVFSPPERRLRQTGILVGSIFIVTIVFFGTWVKSLAAESYGEILDAEPSVVAISVNVPVCDPAIDEQIYQAVLHARGIGVGQEHGRLCRSIRHEGINSFASFDDVFSKRDGLAVSEARRIRQVIYELDVTHQLDREGWSFSTISNLKGHESNRFVLYSLPTINVLRKKLFGYQYWTVTSKRGVCAGLGGIRHDLGRGQSLFKVSDLIFRGLSLSIGAPDKTLSFINGFFKGTPLKNREERIDARSEGNRVANVPIQHDPPPRCLQIAIGLMLIFLGAYFLMAGGWNVGAGRARGLAFLLLSVGLTWLGCAHLALGVRWIW